MEAIVFYASSSVAIISALLVVFLSKPSRALLCLIVTMASLAVLFTLLGAYFVAMAHLVVYAGAVLVLFLFVIMLQGVGATDIRLPQRFPPLFLIAVNIIILIFMGCLLLALKIGIGLPFQGVMGTAEQIGTELFKSYVLPFELTSILLLLGVFAAVSLAKKEEEPS